MQDNAKTKHGIDAFYAQKQIRSILQLMRSARSNWQKILFLCISH